MPTYVAFLRAINLGSVRKFPKADLVAATERAGGTDVATHLNTGNVRLASSRRSVGRVAADLERAYAEDRGFAVPTVVLTLAELRALADDAAELAGLAGEVGGQYVALLRDEPDPGLVREAEEAASHVPGERLVVRGRGAHLLLTDRDAYHRATLSAAWVEKRLGVATSRNVTVVRHLARAWGGA